MRGLRRHEEKHGLADDRRTLINRYMVELVDPPEPAEAPPAELAQEPPEPQEPLEPLTRLVVVESEPAPDPTPPTVVFHPVGPTPEHRERGEVSVETFRQTLEHVARLCSDLAEARAESSRRRAQLAMHR